MHTLKPALFILLLLSIVITVPHFWSLLSGERNKEITVQENNINKNVFNNIVLTAKAAVVYDIANNSIIFEKNKDQQFALASLTKIMTALVAKESYSNNQRIVISENSLEPEGDSGFSLGELWNTKNLIDFTLITSSNDGARALASAGSARFTRDFTSGEWFVLQMNKKARVLGLSQTYFLNESGLDISEEGFIGGAYGSANDIAKLVSYTIIKHPRLLEATTKQIQEISSSEQTYEAENTNEFVETIPEVIASKTGFTDIAGGNLTVAFEAGPMRPIVIVTLGSTKEDRFSDVEQLVWKTLETISR